MSRGCYWYRCQKLSHKGTPEISQLWLLKLEKLQFMGGVVDLSLCQTPTGVGNDGIGSVITSLVEETAPRPDLQALVWSLKGFLKSA